MNKQTNKQQKGAKLSHQQVPWHKAVADVWADLGLQEMPDTYSDSDESRLGLGSPSWWNQSWFYNPL